MDVAGFCCFSGALAIAGGGRGVGFAPEVYEHKHGQISAPRDGSSEIHPFVTLL
jgi:hypothetical protein